MGLPEQFEITAKGPIPKREGVIPVVIDYKPEAPIVSEKPCGCQGQGTLRWGTFSHMIYTIKGEQLEIKELSGYKCDNCDLVLLFPEAGEALREGVEKALRAHDHNYHICIRKVL